MSADGAMPRTEAVMFTEKTQHNGVRSILLCDGLQNWKNGFLFLQIHPSAEITHFTLHNSFVYSCLLSILDLDLGLGTQACQEIPKCTWSLTLYVSVSTIQYRPVGHFRTLRLRRSGAEFRTYLSLYRDV